MLRSREWQSLADHRREWEIQIVVPEVVVVETVNMMRKHWELTQAAVAKLQVGEFGLSALHQEMADTIATYCENYEQSLLDRLTELGAEVVPPPAIDYMDIVRRAVHEHPPYGGKERSDGFRDAVIWHTLIAVALEHPDEDIWFVSNNIKDFGPTDGRWTSDGTGTRDDCPIVFHEMLAAELQERGIGDRVKYVMKLARLEQYIASRYAPIEVDELEKLIVQVDDDSLETQLLEAISGIVLRPRGAALDLDVTTARALSARTNEDSVWNFEEAARRGDAGWTARVTVQADVDVETYQGAAPGETVTKPLLVAGDITISPDDTAIAFEITSVEALPGDPMRAAWRRRDNSQAGISFGSLFTSEETADMFRAAMAPTFRSIAEQNAGTLSAALAGMPTFGDVISVPGMAEMMRAAMPSAFVSLTPEQRGRLMGLQSPGFSSLSAMAQNSLNGSSRTKDRVTSKEDLEQVSEEVAEAGRSERPANKKSAGQRSQSSKPRKSVEGKNGASQDPPAANTKPPREGSESRKKSKPRRKSQPPKKSGPENT